MRFHAAGPSIPDELLDARDEGQVIFFCGSGVSRAKANLADFYGLARQVLDYLGASPDSAARKVIEAAHDQPRIPGVGGLVSADRVFSLLEWEFDVRQIHEAVARALKVDHEVDLSAHRYLLDLARTPTGSVRLVTTNFDRLFEHAMPRIPVYTPRSLPSARSSDLSGIIHLHGIVNSNYSGAVYDDFVLSTAEFGRAYLSEGWATDFMRSLIGRYQIVFVGYSADDPPIHYLLEALNSGEAKTHGLYAFQAGDPEEARTLWAGKGVSAIPYEDGGQHEALWLTLEAWAERARDPDRWHDQVIGKAAQGPASMQPHERGQIKHIVSSVSGSRRFALTAPPAEWLAVFDPALRFSLSPADAVSGSPRAAFSLDDDETALPHAANGRPEREAPPAAWDAFAPNRQDIRNLSEPAVSRIFGRGSNSRGQVPPRLWNLGVIWLSKIADQPIVPWWVAGKGEFIQDALDIILREFQKKAEPPSAVEFAWRLLKNSQNYSSLSGGLNWFELEGGIRRYGWAIDSVHAWAAALRPGIVAGRPFGIRDRLPSAEGDAANKLVEASVTYPEAHTVLEVPDHLLGKAVQLLSANLELAVELEEATGSYELRSLPPILPQEADNADRYGREEGLSGLFLRLAGLFARLARLDPKAARRQLAFWDATVPFERLRIWAASLEGFLTPSEAGSILAGLSEDSFWNAYGQRDLLLSIASRWGQMPPRQKARIEGRMLAGSAFSRKSGDPAYVAREALERLSWLRLQGCVLSEQSEQALEKLRRQTAHWLDDFALRAADSNEPKVGWVKTDKSADPLLDVRPSELLAEAERLTGRDPDLGNFVERRPLEGLAESRPAKLLRALSIAAKASNFPTDSWAVILKRTEAGVRPRLLRTVAQRLATIPVERSAQLVRPIAEWMRKVGNDLIKADRHTYQVIWGRLVKAIQLQPALGASAVVGQGTRDWITSAINSPSGMLAQGVMDLDERNAFKTKRFSPQWLGLAEDILSLPDDAGRFARIVFLYNLNWFYWKDQEWTEKHLIGVRAKVAIDTEVFWAGVFWPATMPSALLMTRLKPQLLELASSASVDHHVAERLAGYLLAAWTFRRTGQPRLVSDPELHDALLFGGDVFRAQFLNHVKRARPSSRAAWRRDIITLFTAVWPKQKTVRTARISTKLAEFALDNLGDISSIVDLILPHIGKIDDSGMILFHIQESRLPTSKSIALKQIRLIHALLAEDASDWPYGAKEFVLRIIDVGGLENDPLATDLRRRIAAAALA